MLKKLILASCCILFNIAFMHGQTINDLVVGEAKKQAGGFTFTEGPSPDKEGNVYFTDQPNNKIHVWHTNGKTAVFMDGTRRSNGTFFDNEGNLISCADEKNQLVKITLAKKINVLADGFEGKLFNGPNDVWVHPDGGYYFTDSYYKRPWWDHKEQPQPVRGVFYLSADTETLIRVIDDYEMPNGIIGTPDGKTLYVADINAGETWAYDINADGTLSNKRFFAPEGSDGMTIDQEGNVYLTNTAVSVFNPKGEKIGTIEIPETPANVCFAGKDRKMLFVTARTSVYTVPMKVAGAY